MTDAAAPLPDPALEAVAQRVAALVLSAPRHTDVILTRAEAREYVKRRSEGNFCAWCRKYRVKPRERGRYSRFALDRALELEAGPRPLRRVA